jgi:AMP phosphorylase
MLLKAKVLEFEAKKPVAVLNKSDAEDMDVKPLERLEIICGKKSVVAIVNIAERTIKQGQIGFFEEIVEELGIKNGQNVNVYPVQQPNSMEFIRKKLSGENLTGDEIEAIVMDTVNHRLSDIELTSFVCSLHDHGITFGEAAALSNAMAKTGKSLNLGKRDVYDKHSIGGIPGDKTSVLLVPMIGAAGLTIPKTSSRAITSPAGTADRFECIAPVELDMKEVGRVVKKVGACLVWGGAVDLSPADDIFIQIEYPLSIDPLLLQSVMSKKKAVGANYLVIDIPTGKGAKIKTVSEAEKLAGKFIELGKRLKIDVIGISTFGDQPLGHAIGPGLEAREALNTIITGIGPNDLVDKATQLAGTLMSFKKKGDTKAQALNILKTKKAYKKLKEIIEAQGGNPEIKPHDIPIGCKKVQIVSNVSGTVLSISNSSIARIARAAGAPKDSGAGVYIHKKLRDCVKRGDVLFDIYADKTYKMNAALKLTKEGSIITVGDKFNMLLKRIPSTQEKKYFILER